MNNVSFLFLEKSVSYWIYFITDSYNSMRVDNHDIQGPTKYISTLVYHCIIVNIINAQRHGYISTTKTH